MQDMSRRELLSLAAMAPLAGTILRTGAAAGVELYRKENRLVNLQFEVNNLTDRVNVLNFAGLFSGTAVAAPRNASAHLRFTF